MKHTLVGWEILMTTGALLAAVGLTVVFLVMVLMMGLITLFGWTLSSSRPVKQSRAEVCEQRLDRARIAAMAAAIHLSRSGRHARILNVRRQPLSIWCGIPGEDND